MYNTQTNIMKNNFKELIRKLIEFTKELPAALKWIKAH